MRLFPGPWAPAALLALLVAPASAQLQTQFQALEHGLLPGTDRSVGTRVSADGRTMLVECRNGSQGLRSSFIRTPGLAQSPLVAPAPWTHAHGTAMDRSGTVVAGTLSRAGRIDGGVFLWSPAGGVVEVTALPAAGLLSFSDVRLSDDGSVLAGTASGGAAGPQPFLWSATGGLVLPAATSPVNFTQQLLSGDGSTLAGWFTDSTSLWRACRWSQAGGFEALGTVLPMGNLFRCTGISTDGDTIVGYEIQGSSDLASFRWTAAGGIAPVVPVPGATRVQVFGMTPSGDTMVGSLSAPGGFAAGPVGFRMGTGQPADLIDPTPYPFGAGQSVDDAGDVVLGLGYHPQHGEGTPFVWTEADGLRWLVGYRHFPVALSADGRHGLGFRRGVSFSSPTESVSWDFQAPGAPLIGFPNGVGAAANSTGQAARAFAHGSLAAASNDLTIAALGLPPGVFCMVLAAPDRALTPGFGGGLGTLLLGGGLARFDGVGQIRRSDNFGLFTLTVDLTAFPSPVGIAAIQPGDVRSFQVWHRDTSGGPTSNLSTAVEITFQ